MGEYRKDGGRKRGGGDEEGGNGIWEGDQTVETSDAGRWPSVSRVACSPEPPPSAQRSRAL